MRGTFEPYAALYDLGLAVGYSSIRDDTLHFEYRDGERYTFPTVQAHPVATYNGYFWTARINDLRMLQIEVEKAKEK